MGNYETRFSKKYSYFYKHKVNKNLTFSITIFLFYRMQMDQLFYNVPKSISLIIFLVKIFLFFLFKVNATFHKLPISHSFFHAYQQNSSWLFYEPLSILGIKFNCLFLILQCFPTIMLILRKMNLNFNSNLGNVRVFHYTPWTKTKDHYVF